LPNIEHYLTTEAARHLRAAIYKAKGAGLYHLGQRSKDGRIARVKLLCKESSRTPMLLFSVPQMGDIIIHNHEDPMLLPKTTDEEYAKRSDEKGIGYLLIDNRVEQAHLIVEGAGGDAPQMLDEEEVLAALRQGGALAKQLERYEERHEQMEMIRGVIRAFNHDQIFLVEAGTGTGKSLAYLLPAVHWAVTNRERIVISTKTINLQEQIFYKDVPFLQHHLGLAFTAVMVKGRNNYLCIRRMHQVNGELQHSEEVILRKQAQEIFAWSQDTTSGDRADLRFLPEDQLWSRLQADGDACQRTKCEHYKSCFYYLARRKQADADILVTNHHVLFADLALRESTGNFHAPALLPPYHRIVFDEAHNLEDAASAFLGFQISPLGVLQQIGKLLRTQKNEESGLFHQLGGLILQHEAKIKGAALLRREIFESLIPQLRQLREETTRKEQMLRGLLLLDAEEERPPSIKIRVTPSFRKQGPWRDLCEAGIAWGQILRSFVQAVMGFAAQLEEAAKSIEKEIGDPLMEIGGIVNRLGQMAATLDLFFDEQEEEDESEGLVRWFDVQTQAQGRVRMQAAPLEVGHALGRMIYDQFATLVLTSATLSTGQEDFSFLRQRLGMEDLPQSRILEASFPSPFDYKQQSLIAIPTDLPAPNERSFQSAIVEFIDQAIQASDGRAFILCTSFSLLRFLYTQLAPRFQRLDIRSLCQGHAPRHALLQQKIDDPRSVLFGTDSFWEGVDVQGHALCNVILTRLPFRVPSDPLIEARVEAIENKGENSFMRYTVPSATIQFKQGFGRLIRSKTDRGNVLILDKRVIEKRYGQTFLNALPPDAPRLISTQSHIIQHLKTFHRDLHKHS
jgi:ATP-dependent DNA helicase DinG